MINISENEVHGTMFRRYPDLMTVEELQEALGIGRTMAYRLVNNGKIRCLRLGKTIKVPKQYLVDFVVKSCYNEYIATGNTSCHYKGGQ